MTRAQISHGLITSTPQAPLAACGLTVIGIKARHRELAETGGAHTLREPMKA